MTVWFRRVPLLIAVLLVAATPLAVGALEPGQTHGTGKYQVRSGDTVTSIANRLHIAGGWQALYQANRDVIGPNPDALKDGLTLVVPASSSPSPTAAPGGYLVKQGDSLRSIADDLHVAGGPTALYDANRTTIGPDPNRLQVGAELALPHVPAKRTAPTSVAPPRATPSHTTPAAEPDNAGTPAVVTRSNADAATTSGRHTSWLLVILGCAVALAVITLLVALGLHRRRRRRLVEHRIDQNAGDWREVPPLPRQSPEGRVAEAQESALPESWRLVTAMRAQLDASNPYGLELRLRSLLHDWPTEDGRRGRAAQDLSNELRSVLLTPTDAAAAAAHAATRLLEDLDLHWQRNGLRPPRASWEFAKLLKRVDLTDDSTAAQRALALAGGLDRLWAGSGPSASRVEQYERLRRSFQAAEFNGNWEHDQRAMRRLATECESFNGLCKSETRSQAQATSQLLSSLKSAWSRGADAKGTASAGAAAAARES